MLGSNINTDTGVVKPIHTLRAAIIVRCYVSSDRIHFQSLYVPYPIAAATAGAAAVGGTTMRLSRRCETYGPCRRFSFLFSRFVSLSLLGVSGNAA